MEKIIELANQIKDENLRKKVIEFIKNPTLSHKDFKKYPRTEMKDVKTLFSVGRVTAERDLLNHTITVTETCIAIADILQKNYGIPINKDYLIAGSLLHDIMKMFEWKSQGEEVEHSGITLDHSLLAVAEFYHRGFPEQVIHMIASHLQGESGPTPPRNFEALILYYVDTLLSLTEFHWNVINKPKPKYPVILLDEETIKKLGEKTEEREEK
ncbi:MAG: HDIG domain-containing protein [Candidatus Aenigmatarchaeota archaeon]